MGSQGFISSRNQTRWVEIGLGGDDLDRNDTRQEAKSYVLVRMRRTTNAVDRTKNERRNERKNKRTRKKSMRRRRSRRQVSQPIDFIGTKSDRISQQAVVDDGDDNGDDG